MPKHKGGKKGKDRRSSHLKAYYERQRVRTESNKRIRRLRHMANHPNDLQNRAILKELV
jgi:hypothetical protein